MCLLRQQAREGRDLGERGGRRSCLPIYWWGVSPGGALALPQDLALQRPHRAGEASSAWLRLLWVWDSTRRGHVGPYSLGVLTSSPHPSSSILLLCPNSGLPPLLSNSQPAKPYQPIPFPSSNSKPQPELCPFDPSTISPPFPKPA